MTSAPPRGASLGQRAPRHPNPRIFSLFSRCDSEFPREAPPTPPAPNLVEGQPSPRPRLDRPSQTPSLSPPVRVAGTRRAAVPRLAALCHSPPGAADYAVPASSGIRSVKAHTGCGRGDVRCGGVTRGRAIPNDFGRVEHNAVQDPRLVCQHFSPAPTVCTCAAQGPGSRAPLTTRSTLPPAPPAAAASSPHCSARREGS